MAAGGAGPIKRVVIMVQENHTTDNYFRGLAPWGANVVTDWPTCANPPPQPPFSAYYPPHHRKAYFDWLMGGKAEHSQFDTAADLPYYLYLALTGAFLENHCAGFGTNSTPNHLLLVGGQTPTLTNPPRRAEPVWDMPSLPGLAQDKGVSWRCYTDGGYPVKFYQQLQGSPNIVPSSQFVADAAAGTLPALAYLWHGSGQDEHPPSNITDGMNAIWQSVDAVVQAGGWAETVFMLTWDDWGGFDDHVPTPVTEYTPDNVQLAYGPRVPLLMFGGYVKPGIDSRWCSHVSIPKTAIQLLGLPNLGVPRLDGDAGLADLVDLHAAVNAQPPGYGQAINLPNPPAPPKASNPLPPPPGAEPIPVGEVMLRDGTTLPPPNDAPLPRQPAPPTNAARPASRTRRPFGGVGAGPRQGAHHGPKVAAPAVGGGQFPNFVNHGGPVVTAPQVFTSFWGSLWNTDAAFQQRASALVQYHRDLLQSGFMNMLAQYGVGAGTFLGQKIITNVSMASPTGLTQQDIAQTIQTAIDAGQIPEPGNPSNVVLMIYLDETIGVNDTSDPNQPLVLCEAQNDSAFGFHSFFTTAAGNPFYYAVVPGLTDACLHDSCPGGDAGCSLQSTEALQDRLTQVASHEFAELTTDPQLNAWYDPGAGENGDICNGQSDTITVGANTWTVQRIYSKYDDEQSGGATICSSQAPNPLPAV